MSIQVIVRYWNTENLGFGHVSIQVIDLKFQDRSCYIAMGNTLADDMKKYKIDPIKIILPSNKNVLFDDFVKKYKASYYPQDKSIDGKEYNFFTANCANCVEDVLMMCGYTAKASGRSLLQPSTVAKETCLMGIERCNVLKKGVFSEVINTNEQFKCFLTLLILHLQLQANIEKITSINYSLLDHISLIFFPASSMYDEIQSDINLLNIISDKLIMNSFSSNIEAISKSAESLKSRIAKYDVSFLLTFIAQKTQNITQPIQNKEKMNNIICLKPSSPNKKVVTSNLCLFDHDEFNIDKILLDKDNPFNLLVKSRVNSK